MMPAIVFLKSHFIFIEFDDRMNVGFAERTLLIVESIFNLIKTINDAVNGFVWGLPAIVCIVGVGILLSIRTRFIQFRRFGYALKATIGKLFSKSEASHGSITPVQAVCTALAATVGTGNATQVNTITTAVNTALTSFNIISPERTGTVSLVLGIVIAIVVALVLLGGIKRIGKVSETLVPFMALLYIILALGVVLLNIDRIPSVFASIIHGAFSPSAVTGGVVGSMFLCMQKGVSRGIFSNEAGLGTGSIAHATSDVRDPVDQGVFGIFEVFMDTIIICTLTALTILCSGISVNYGAAAGAELTISGFTATYGNWVSIFTAVAMCCFAFSTILGWGLYGARCLEYLASEKWIKPFMVVYSLVAILGATVSLDLLWSIAETFNGLMAIPNLIALFLLSGTVVKLVRERNM